MTDPQASTAAQPPALVLYGGTFDPIHRAHVAVARTLARTLDCPVTLLPNYRSPLKDSPQAGDQRLTLIRLAIQPYPELRVDDRELLLPQASYTVDTLQAFRCQQPRLPIIWLMGADSYCSLQHWHRYQELPSLCHLAVAPRPGVTLESPCLADTLFTQATADALLQSPAGLCYRMPRPLLDVSATAIRSALKHKGTCPALDQSVLRYIQQHGLYGCRTTT